MVVGQSDSVVALVLRAGENLHMQGWEDWQEERITWREQQLGKAQGENVPDACREGSSLKTESLGKLGRASITNLRSEESSAKVHGGWTLVVKPGVSWRKGLPTMQGSTDPPNPNQETSWRRVCPSAQSKKPGQLRRTDAPPTIC